jgi:hypothetical protein
MDTAMERAAVPERRGARWPDIAMALAAFAQDTFIAVNLATLALFAATGGIETSWLSITRPERAIVLLLIAIPLRLTFGGPTRILWVRDEHITRWILTVKDAIGRLPPSLADAGFALLVTRPIAIGVAFIANITFTPHRTRPFAIPFEHLKIAEIFAAWDSGWYFDIASRGYYFREDGQSSVAFFPLYPMLMKAVGWMLGGSDKAVWIAGIAVSWVAFVAALLVLHRLTSRLFADRQVARRAVLYLAVFPFSIFFTRVYAESVFLLASVLAVTCAVEKRWWGAGVAGALATLARPNGILIGVPLLILALAGDRSLRAFSRRLIPLVLPPLALAGYSAFVYTLSGDPLAWLRTEVHWGYSLGHPPLALLTGLLGRLLKYGFYDYFFLSSSATYHLLHGTVALVFLALTPAVFKRLGAAMGAYVLISLLVPLSGNALEGIGRYASVLFPVFIVVAQVNSQRLHEVLLIVGSVARALMVSLFSTGQPIY